MYDTTKLIQEQVDKSKLETDTITQVGRTLTTQTEILDKNFYGLKTFAQDNLSKMATKIRNLENKRSTGAGVSNSLEYKRLLDRIGIVDEITDRHTRDIGIGERNVMRIDAEVTNLKRKFDSMDPIGALPGAHAQERLSDDGLNARVRVLENHALNNDSRTALEEKFEVLGHEFDMIGDRLDKVETKGTDESFEMEGFAFASYADFAKTVLNEKIPSCGMCWDLFSCLVSMRPKGLTGKERADEQHSSVRINTSTFENNLLAAMGHARPSCLYGSKGGTGELVDSEKGFGACLSYTKWRAGVDSVKKVLTKQLKDFAMGVQGNIRSSDGGYGLAKQLLVAVKEQWYELLSWMDEFYKQLTEEANFKEDAAWRLVGRCVAAIFDAMADFRARVALIEDPKPLENKAKIMWCVLQCHTVIESFIAVKFQGHPILVKEITMFMLTERIDPEDLNRMQTKLEAQKSLNATAITRLADLEKVMNELKRAFDNHVANAFHTLKNKVHSKS
jgi:hypothetical protein